jgi:ABC-type nitrate/sulfonate/bicarbonate transport system substrate-binding protein
MKKFFAETALWIFFFSLGIGSAPISAAALEQINASYGAISGSMAPIWVAKEARFFEKQGFDLNLVYIPGGPRSIMSMLAGSVQFVNHSGMPALEAHQRGADTAMIASSMNRLEHAIVVQQNITSVEQLRGKVLGISALGSLTDILMREGLHLNGLSEKDVTIIPLGDEGARLTGLQTGRVNGAIISGIQRLTATRMGFRPLIDFAKLPIEVSGSSILVRHTYVVKNPDITLRFLKAWIEGIYLFKTNPEFALGVLKKYVASKDTEVLSAIYTLNKKQLSTRPVPDARVVKSMLHLLLRTRPDIPGGDPSDFAEPRFIKELENSGFFEEMNRHYAN